MRPLFIIFIMLVLTITISKASGPVRIMPVGNSITAGEHYGGPPKSERTGYRKDLYNMLIEDGYNVDFVGSQNHGMRPIEDSLWYDWDSEAYPGWQIPEIAQKTIEALNVYNPDILLIHAGTNGENWPPKPGQVMNMLDSINHYSIVNSHPMKVFLCKIINRFYLENQVPTSQFNINVTDSVAARSGDIIDIFMVDMENGAGLDYTDSLPDPYANPPYEGGDFWGFRSPYIYYDKFHPNDKGNTKMAVKFYQELIQKLDPPETLANNIITDVEVTVRKDSSLLITWTGNFIDEDGYIIERAEPGGSFTIVDTAGENTRYYIDKSITGFNEYNYRVKAFNSGSVSQYSAVASYIPTFYELTLNVDGQGTAEANPGGSYYLAGLLTPVTLTATPDQGWEFEIWTGDIHNFAYANPIDIIMGKDKTITANFTQVSDINEDVSNIPKKFFLYQNFPNPFNPSTNIKFDLPVKSFVTVKVFDILGKEVTTLFEGDKQPGTHSVAFDASSLSSGIYFYRVETEKSVGVKRFLLMK